MAGLKRPIAAAGPDVRKIARQLEKGLSGDKVKVVEKAAKAAKIVHNHEIAKVAGSDMRLSGVNRAKGRKGNVRVGTRYKVKAKGYAMADGMVSASGPLHLVERNTSGHVIRSAWGTGVGRRGLIGPTLPGAFAPALGRNVQGPARPNSKAVLNIPGIGYRRSARHPGTKGQKPWEKGYKRAQPAIRKIMRSEVFSTVKANASP